MWQGHDNILADVRAELRNLILGSVNSAREEGVLNISAIPEFPLQKPDQHLHGDLATSLALMLAKEAKMAPRQIAEIIANGIDTGDLIEKIEIAGPGFINFFLTNGWLCDLLHTIQEKGEQFGKTDRKSVE